MGTYEIVDTPTKRLVEKQQYKEINELIDWVLQDNLLETTNTKQYIKYLEQDIQDLEEMKENNQIGECLHNHLVEELELLRDIITTIKGV